MGGSPPSPRGPLAAPHLHLNCERNSSGESGGGRRKNRSSLREKASVYLICAYILLP